MRLLWIVAVGVVALLGGVSSGQAAPADPGGPLARNDVFLIEWDGTQHELEVLANDSGAGDLTVVAVGPTTGSASIRPDEDGKVILFWPAGDFRGAEAFTYTLVDENGITSTGRVKVTEQFDYVLSGTKTWALSYGSGTGALGGSGFSFSQSLAVDLWAEALGVLTVSAEFDDQSELKDQHLSVELETEYVTGVLGDFSLTGAADLFVYNRTMTGVRVDVFPAGRSTTGPELTAVASQLQGISRSITIVGESASATSVFSAADPDAPWEEATYTRHIDGLASYTLDDPLVRGITMIRYTVPSSSQLAAILVSYGLGLIAPALETRVTEFPPLEATFASLADVQRSLVLKSAPRMLLRTITRAAIADYNRSIAEGESTIRYPFVQHSDLESEFLDQLGSVVAFLVGDQIIPLVPSERNRFYSLGHGGIHPSSLRVEATSFDGTTVLTEADAGDEGTPNTYRLFAESGILELWLPDRFFEDSEAAITATYTYAREGQLIVLDFGAVSDSVQVRLNGQLLEEGTGYEVDYTDPATVLLLEEIGPEDVVQIEYEQFRGGLGSAAEFATAFFGAQVTFPIADVVQAQLSILRSADIADGAAEDPTLRTMPNTQTVVGLDASFDLDPLAGTLMLGYNDNVFPSDDNVRPSLPNQITKIAVDQRQRRLLFAHYQGLTVLEGGQWETFDSSTGLASSRIYDLAISADLDRVYLATAAGLTEIDTTGETPFDRVDRWTNLNSDVGLPDGELHVVAIVGETIWVGAEDALARARWDETDLAEAWVSVPVPGIDPRVLIESPGGRVLIGTEDGAWWLELELELEPSTSASAASLIPISALQGVAVRDAAVFGDLLWIASDEGLGRIGPQGRFEWLITDRAVRAVCAGTDGVFYATDNGVYDLTLPEPLLEADRITALACTPGSLWTGQQAATDADYPLYLWSLDIASSPGIAIAFDNATTGIDGRDPLYYSALDPAAHTSQGWIMRLGFQRDYGVVDLDGSLTFQDPGFSAIGRIDRNNVAGWSLSIASAPDALENLDYELSHEYTLAGRNSDSSFDIDPAVGMRSELENKIDLRFDLTDVVAALSSPLPTADPRQGPVVSATVSHNATSADGWDEDDAWQVAHSLRVSDSLLPVDSPIGSQDLLSVSFTTSGTIDEMLRRTSRLSASTAITPPGAISVNADWNRNLSFSSGSASAARKESFSLSTDWNPELSDAPFATEASYRATGMRTARQAKFAVDHELAAELRLDALPFAGGTLTPRFETDASIAGGALGLEFKVSTPVQSGSRSLRPAVALEVSGLGKLRTESEQRLDVSYYDRSSDRLQPSLSATLRRTTVTYIGSKSTSWSLTLSPRLKWSPVPQVGAEIYGSMTATIANDQWTMSGSVRGDADAPLTALFPALVALAEPAPPATADSTAEQSIEPEAGDATPNPWRAWIAASNVSANLSGNASLRSGRWSFGITARGQISTPIGDAWSTGLSLHGELSKLADLDSVDAGWSVEVHAAVQF